MHFDVMPSCTLRTLFLYAKTFSHKEMKEKREGLGPWPWPSKNSKYRLKERLIASAPKYTMGF